MNTKDGRKHGSHWVVRNPHLLCLVDPALTRCLSTMLLIMLTLLARSHSVDGIVWYGTVRYGTVRYGTVRYGTVRYGIFIFHR